MCQWEPGERPEAGGEDAEVALGTGVQILPWGDLEQPVRASVAVESPGQQLTPCAEPGSSPGAGSGWAVACVRSVGLQVAVSASLAVLAAQVQYGFASALRELQRPSLLLAVASPRRASGQPLSLGAWFPEESPAPEALAPEGMHWRLGALCRPFFSFGNVYLFES